MPKVHNLEEQWSRSLTMADLLRVAEELEVLADDDRAPILEAYLRDGSRLRGAQTVAALRAELDAEAENDVQSIRIGLGPAGTAVTWLNWEKNTNLSLSTSGEVEVKVHGTFGPIKRRIDSRFEAIDRGDIEPTGSRPMASADPVVGDGGVTIGSISAGSVSVSSSGLAAASSGPLAEPPSRWWQQAWITVGAPVIVLVVGGIILALVLGH